MYLLFMKNPKNFPLAFATFLVVTSATISAFPDDRAGEDWPVFLGPRGNGTSTETGLLEKWPKKGPPVLWKKKIGTGYSAPSVMGNRVVVHHRIKDNEIVNCFRVENGENIWSYRYPSAFKDPYDYSNGPRCTPLLTKSRCYTYGAEGKLLCLDLQTGKKIWLRDVFKDFDILDEDSGKPNWFFGIGCTPVLEGNLLIALVGGQPNSGVVAFDATTGKTVWQNVGRDVWNGAKTGWPAPIDNYKWTGKEHIVSYSSPIVATIHGKRHLLCLMRQGLVSLDPKTGKLNFKHWFRSRTHESVNAARPVIFGDKIFLSAAYKVGSALLQVNPDGKGYKVLWKRRKNLNTHWSTSIHAEGYIYGFSGRNENEGILTCISEKDGKVQWKSSGFSGNIDDLNVNEKQGKVIDNRTGKTISWPFFGRASQIKIGNKFLILSERGTLILAKIDPKKYREISRAAYPQLRPPVWAAPVLSRKRLFLRSVDTLLCLDFAPQKSSSSH